MTSSEFIAMWNAIHDTMAEHQPVGKHGRTQTMGFAGLSKDEGHRLINVTVDSQGEDGSAAHHYVAVQ